MNYTDKRRRPRYGLVGVSIALGLCGEASAQTDSPKPDTPAEEVSLSEIVVTGSRAVTQGFKAPTPLTVIDSDKITSLAPTSIGEAFVRLPEFRDASSNQQAGRFANGSQYTPDLRGLGPQRTLVLVDGQRWVPTNPNGTVDTTLIPASLVQRMDVVTGGASSAYGSDAVSGVVNFILKDRLEGVSASAQYGASQHGGGDEHAYSLAAGSSFFGDRLHVVAGGDFANDARVGSIYSRAGTADQQWLVTMPANRPAGVPARVFETNVTYSAMTPGSLVLSGPLAGTAFGPNGTAYAFQPGQAFGNVMVGGSNPGMNPAGNYWLVQPVQRYSALARASFDVNDDTELFAQASYGHHTTTGVITWYTSPSFKVGIDNPFMPDSIRTQMQSLGLTSLTLGRINTDLGGGRYHVDKYDTQRYVLGGKGRIGNLVDWDAYYEHGIAASTESLPTDVIVPNFLAAIDAVTGANGAPECAPLASNPNLTPAKAALVQPGCAPFNVFGPNSRSAAAYDYVTGGEYFRNLITQDALALNLRAKPFSTWAGPVSFAIGAEARRDRVSVVSDPLSQLGEYTIYNMTPYSGSNKVEEGYLEAAVPLVADTVWAKSLDLDAAARVTHYSTSGTVETWKAGLAYETPFGLRLRAARSRDIRAPSLQDLYATPSIGAILNGAQNPFNGQTGVVNALSGGNAKLRPEVANTTTAGAIFEPQWLPGFNVSVDHYDIRIQDVITTPTAQEVLNQCQGGNQTYCNLIAQDNSTFGIAYVRLTPANLDRRLASGEDIELGYNFALSRISASLPGDIALRMLATHVDHLQITNAGATVERAGSGVGGLPSWTYDLDVIYSLSRFRTDVNIRGFNSFKWDSTVLGPEDAGYAPTSPASVSLNRFPGFAYVNWSASYDVYRSDRSKVQLFGVVNNVFDRNPPEFTLVAFPLGGDPYDVMGRYFRIGVRVEL